MPKTKPEEKTEDDLKAAMAEDLGFEPWMMNEPLPQWAVELIDRLISRGWVKP